MNVIARLRRWLRLRYHRREIEASAAHFSRRSRVAADQKQSYSDSGSFRFQVDRLFASGTAGETEPLTKIAEATVSACVTNRYYRPADYLSDIVDALERQTYLGVDPEGEPPLDELDETGRRAKLARISASWLLPIKVGSIETVVGAFARTMGKSLPYRSLAAFERQAAALFALLGDAELHVTERRIIAHLEVSRERFAAGGRSSEAPADYLQQVVRCLEGREVPPGVDHVQPRAPHLPIRFSTVQVGDRHDYLEASFSAGEKI